MLHGKEPQLDLVHYVSWNETKYCRVDISNYCDLFIYNKREVRYKLQKADWDLLMIVKAQDPKDETENQLLHS